MDWQISPKFNFSFSQIMLDETETFIRYNFLNNIDLSLHYLSTNHSNSEIFFKRESILLNNKTVSYNNITQKQKGISLRLGVKVFKDIGVIISYEVFLINRI